MGRHAPKPQGMRISAWIPARYVKDWKELENKSAFLQLALNDMVGLMTWAILVKHDPEKYQRPIDKKKPSEVIPEFNKEFPLDPLTKKRLNKQKEQIEKWNGNSPKLHDVL